MEQRLFSSQKFPQISHKDELNDIRIDVLNKHVLDTFLRPQNNTEFKCIISHSKQISFTSSVMWNEIFPAILVGKKCHSYQWFLASKCEWGLPKGNTIPVTQQMLPPLQWLQRSSEECKKQLSSAMPHGEQGIKDVTIKKQEVVPDTCSTYERKEFSEPRGLQIPIEEC